MKHLAVDFYPKPNKTICPFVKSKNRAKELIMRTNFCKTKSAIKSLMVTY
jgi:hypothetical protein